MKKRVEEFDYKEDVALAKKMGWDKHHSDWQGYITYLKEWADSHADETYMFMSPVCYEEWLDNEGAEE